MDHPDEGKKQGKPRILVAPLDWGLGHATRCIPIIRELTDQGAEVILAGEGAQESLLRTEFPELPFVQLQGYRIRYGRSGPGLLRNILYQTPKILGTIKKENAWLEEMVIKLQLDGVISDNRYGLHHKDIPCVFMTHQLLIKTPWGKFTDQLLQKRNYGYIEKFNACWVPDAAAEGNLAGELSHPFRKPFVPVIYTGILSRFQYTGSQYQQGHILILISGPEPQRTLFENMLIDQLAVSAVKATVVRGLPGNSQFIPSGDQVNFYNHLPASQLAAEIQKAEYVIARSGYSSIMDLARMKKKTILVPTPGQTEQEWLAKNLSEKKMAFTVSQKDFSLTRSIEEAGKLDYRLEETTNGNELKTAVGRFLELLAGKFRRLKDS